MSDSRQQTFCSFLCCWSDSEEDYGRFDRLTGFLPSYRDEVSVVDFAGGRLYLSIPDTNRLHRWRLQTEGQYVVFLQGEFYEQTDLQLDFPCVGDHNSVDENHLHSLLKRLNGVFSGFVLDTSNGDFHCFSDRYGFSRLFATKKNRTTILSSSFWPIRACDEVQDQLNVSAIHDTLMFGFPLFGDTAFEDIQMCRPGMVLSHVDGRQHDVRYFDFQRNARKRSRYEIVDEFKAISRAHCDSMRQIDSDFNPGVALSGGKDSRVILTGLLESGLKPKCYAGFSGSRCWDSIRGEKVGLAVDCPTKAIDYSEQIEGDFEDSNVIINGNRTGLWTMNLARAASQDGCSVMYFGTTGDVLSGGWTANPNQFGSLSKLSDFSLEDYIEYEFTAARFAHMFTDRSYEDLQQRFRCGHFDDLGDDLSNSAIAFRIMNRNFRRIRTFMSGSIVYLPPVHFFHDNRVSDFYWNLPFQELVNQKAHAAICSINKALGKIPSTSFPFGVRFEPTLVPIMKTLIPESFKDTLRKIVSGKSSQQVRQKPVDPLELQKLLDRARGLGMDPDRLAAFAQNDPKPRLVEQRVMIINTQLDPADLLKKSRLTRAKRLVPLTVSSA